MKNLTNFIIAGLIVVIIIFIMRDCSRPGEEKDAEREKQFKTSVAILEAEKREAKAVADSIISKQQSDTERIKVQLSAKDKEIKVLKVRLIKERTPKVDTLILNNPDLESFVNTQSEIIEELQIQSDTLKHALLNQEKYFMGLVVAHEQERKFSERLVTESLSRVDQLEKQAKKTKKGNRLLKALGVVGVAGAFVLGASL